jgi:hypothetical protein
VDTREGHRGSKITFVKARTRKYGVKDGYNRRLQMLNKLIKHNDKLPEIPKMIDT